MIVLKKILIYGFFLWPLSSSAEIGSQETVIHFAQDFIVENLDPNCAVETNSWQIDDYGWDGWSMTADVASALIPGSFEFILVTFKVKCSGMNGTGMVYIEARTEDAPGGCKSSSDDSQKKFCDQEKFFIDQKTHKKYSLKPAALTDSPVRILWEMQ